MIKLNKPKTLPWQYEALTVKGQSLFLIKKSVGAFLHIQMTERSRVMEALWFVLGFAVTTTVVLATEKLIIKN